MNRYLLDIITASVLLGFTACSQESSDEPVGGDNVIRFQPVVIMGDAVPESRAALLNSLPVGSSFGVLGYSVPYVVGSTTDIAWTSGSSDWEVKKGNVHADVMYKANVRIDEKGCYYDSENCTNDAEKKVGVWYDASNIGGSTVDPSGFKYSFIAYHPYWSKQNDGTSRFTVTPANASAKGAPQLTYKMIYAEKPSSESEKLVRDTEDATDAMVAVVHDHVRASGTVTLPFEHILCGLSVQVNNYNHDNDVTIHRLSVDGQFYGQGTINYADADPKMVVSDDNRYWATFNYVTSDMTVPTNSALICGATTDKPEGTVALLLPNRNPVDAGIYLGHKKNVNIEYTFGGERKTATVANFSLGRVPVPGINYKLNINFIGDQILLMFTADSIEYWEAGSDNNIIIN